MCTIGMNMKRGRWIWRENRIHGYCYLYISRGFVFDQSIEQTLQRHFTKIWNIIPHQLFCFNYFPFLTHSCHNWQFKKLHMIKNMINYQLSITILLLIISNRWYLSTISNNVKFDDMLLVWIYSNMQKPFMYLCGTSCHHLFVLYGNVSSI